jgi:hypothetical protein
MNRFFMMIMVMHAGLLSMDEQSTQNFQFQVDQYQGRCTDYLWKQRDAMEKSIFYEGRIIVPHDREPSGISYGAGFLDKFVPVVYHPPLTAHEKQQLEVINNNFGKAEIEHGIKAILAAPKKYRNHAINSRQDGEEICHIFQKYCAYDLDEKNLMSNFRWDPKKWENPEKIEMKHLMVNDDSDALNVAYRDKILHPWRADRKLQERLGQKNELQIKTTMKSIFAELAARSAEQG